jgi:hypothetical protein
MERNFLVNGTKHLLKILKLNNLLLSGLFLLVGVVGYGQTITISDETVAENVAGNNLIFTVTLDIANTNIGGTSVSYSFSDVTAIGGGTDYDSAGGTVTFPQNDNTPQTITVPINDDAIVEGTETFSITLGTPTGGETVSGSPATGTILNDDSASVTIANISGAENGGAITVTATLDNAVAGGFTVDVSTTDGTATLADSDYTAVTSQVLTFTGTASETQTFTVTPTDDNKVELDETVNVSMDNLVPSEVAISDIDITDTAVVTITDDDSATLTITNQTVDEDVAGGNMVFTVTLNNAVALGTQVGYSFADVTATGGGTDYTGTPGTLTFTGTAGEQETITVPINNDAIVEGTESFTVTLAAPTNGVGVSGSPATGTITDDDSATITIANVSGSEDSGAINVFVILDNAVSGGFTLDVSTADGTATLADNDYTAIVGQTLTFAGTAGEQQIFSVTPIADTDIEANETLTVSMSNLAGTAISVNISDTAIVTINNDDTASVTIADTGGQENSGPITVTATLDNAVPGGFSVNVSTADGTATLADNDYAAIVNQTLSFSGTTGEQQTFTVSPTGDPDIEANETLTVSMSNLSGTAIPIDITDTATITINNDDSSTISINDPASTPEGDSGTQSITFTVSLGQSDPFLPITVNYLISGGNEDTDSGTLTFAAATTILSQDITVTTNGDTLVEGDETIQVTLSNPSINATLTKAIGTSSFTNDDFSNISINDPAAVPEGDAGPATINFAVTIDQSDPASAITVDYVISGGNENGTTGTLTFNAGTPTLTQNIPVTTTGDTDVEANEAITVTLGNPSTNATITKAVGSSSFTNDDTASISVDDPASVAEGNSGIATIDFTVSIDQSDPNNPITVVYTISGGNENGTGATLTFPANTTALTQTVSVTTNGDTAVEADEPITVTLSTPSSNGTIVKAVGTSSFTNDDSSTISINDPTDVLEGDSGVATINFAVTLGQADPNNPITVDYLISGGNQNGTGGTLTFAANTSTLTQTVPVTTNGDIIVQADLPVTVTLSNPSANASLAADNVGESSFIDDDVAGFTVTPLSLATAEGGVFQTFTVVLDAAPASDVVLDVVSSDTSEGTVSPASITFTTGNYNLPRTVTVTPFNDPLVDGDQNYDITVSVDPVISNDFFDALASATVNVTNADDDAAGIIINPISGNTSEAGVAATFSVFLDSEPSADVIIPLSSSDLGEGTIAVTSITLNSGNWNTGVVVTVTGVDDAFVDGPVAYSIITGNVTSADANYDILTGTDVPDVAVTNNDNDTASISINNQTINEGIGT